MTGLAAEDDRLRAESLIERYGNQWIATARRASATSADAEDAYQRALEALLTKPPAETDPERIAAWMHTVIRNEALQSIRSTRREVDGEFEVMAGGLAADVAIPDEYVVEVETHEVAKEALRRLRPDQTRCLLLRADGFDYPEICRVTGFSYAKVNRLLSEGRKAARVRAESIASGRECERIEPLISMLVDRALDEAAENDVQMHVAHCAHCRSTVRDYAQTPRRLAAALPFGAALSHEGWWQRLFDPVRQAAEFVQTRIGGGDLDAGTALAKKALAVVAVGATAAGAGVAVQQSSSGETQKAGAAATAAGGLVDRIDQPAATRTSSRSAAGRARAARDSRESETIGNDRAAGLEAPAPSDQVVVQEAAPRAIDPADQAPEGAADEPAPVNDGVGP